MRAVMYHYVRPSPGDLPHQRYLHVDDFDRQLDLFASEVGYVGQAEFVAAFQGAGPLPQGVLLTFDDGLRDHVEHVLPRLVDRGLWGLFFVPSGPHLGLGVLEVHQIHWLLGALGGSAGLELLTGTLEQADLDRGRSEAFDEGSYRGQDNDNATNEFKRLLNYHVALNRRANVLRRLWIASGLDPPTEHEVYASPDELRGMHQAGMVLGSHGHSHRVLSRLDQAEQAADIAMSFAWLDEQLGRVVPRLFCYPYGGDHTFTEVTEGVLSQQGCQHAFSVEPRDIAPDDLKRHPHRLPRWDCNQFPHGRASGGGPER